MAKKKEQSVLVIGAGVGGVKASLELAESGLKVYLCDISPDIGGTLMQMDKWFPNSHCGMCQMLPLVVGDESVQFCLRRGLNHPNIEFLPLTEIEKLDGEAGNFSATLKTTPMGVQRDLCSGCGLCAEVCPVEVDSEFNQGLAKRKAVYVRNPMVAANAYLIDWDTCTRCGLCAEKCPNQAINLDVQEETREINIGAVVLSTGFEEFNAKQTSEYGYQRYPDVLTSIEMERLLSPSGPTGGMLVRPSDGKSPSSLAFLQCVGSREAEWNYCSSACCMYAIKEAVLAKEANPETDVTIFYMDIRAFGKDNYKYFMDARDRYGIKFVRSRVPVIRHDPVTGSILLAAKSEEGKITNHNFEMVVLSVGQVPPPGFAELLDVLGLEANRWGFCQTEELTPVDAGKEGIYICGSASAPKDISDTLVESGAAAGEILRKLAKPEKHGEITDEIVEEDTSEPKTAVIICACGDEVGSVIDIKNVAEYSKSLPGVDYVTESAFMCQQKTLEELVKELKKSGANRYIFAACSSSAIGGPVTEALENAGIRGAFTQFINLREGIARVHKDQPEAATEKARKLIAMAAERARLHKSSSDKNTAVQEGVLVIGGGLSGMTAALSIAEQGYEAYLIEKSGELGGNLRHIYKTLRGTDAQKLLSDTIKAVEENSLIHLYTGTGIKDISGYAGNFNITLTGDDEELIQAGSIIVATGAGEYKPTEYSCGQSDRVLTQSELEQRLISGNISAENLNSVVMIQCVGSRNEERPYCSRICCSQAIKNSLELKRLNPDIQVFVLYRDMMSYGFMEEYYTRAREAGVIFVRYETEKEPVVTVNGETINVEFAEPVLNDKITLEPDMVVLSPAVLPAESNESLAEMLELELNGEGFFKEAEIKFRPVDFNKEGIYACGLALHPANINESITQAQAAAQRAVTLLRRGYLQPSPVIAEVNPRWCTGCEICIQACPYGARIKDTGKGIVVVRDALCRGCGACAAVCPSGATKLRRFTDKQILSMIDAGV